MRTFVPRDYQWLIIDHILDQARCGVYAEPGTGKTGATLYAIDCLRYLGEGPALVVAPLRVAANTWPAEAAKWSNLSHLKVLPILGTPNQRVGTLHRSADIYTIHYGLLPWLCEYLNGNWPFSIVVADESTRLKSFRTRQGGVQAMALSKVAFGKGSRFIELTGTPSPNGLQDLWGQLYFLDKGTRLGKNYNAFTNRWFKMERIQNFTRLVGPLPHAQTEIQTAIKDVCISIRSKDWFKNLRDPVVVDVPAYLPAAAMKQYKAMEKDFFLQIKDSEVEAKNSAVKSMKCLQMASGAVFVDEFRNWEYIHDAKIEALRSVVEEIGGAPLLVAYHWTHDLIRLKAAFPQARELDKSQGTLNSWNRGEIPMLLAHPQSAGHGLNLQDGGHHIAIFSHWWDLELYQQILERIGPVRQLQSGYERNVFVYNIRAEGTIDSLVIARREGKRSVQDLLLEAARNYA